MGVDSVAVRFLLGLVWGSDMTRTAKKRDQDKVVYTQPGKTMARQVAIACAKLWGARSILDLWGDGESARAFQSAIPEAAVISAEIDKRLWPALMVDAQKHGYGYHLGDVADVPGKWDFIWLDFCGQASKSMAKTLHAAKRQLNVDGLLAVTVMPARESDVLVSQMRERVLPMWIEEQTGCAVRLLLPYRRENNLPMWLLVLMPGWRSFFGDDDYFSIVRDSLNDEGYWFFLGRAIETGASGQEWGALQDLIETHPGFPKPESKWKVSWSDLTPAQRGVVGALLAASGTPQEQMAKERQLIQADAA